MNIKLLTEQHLEFLSIKGDRTGSSESIYVKMPHCWKSHVRAQMSMARKSSAQGHRSFCCFITLLKCQFLIIAVTVVFGEFCVDSDYNTLYCSSGCCGPFYDQYCCWDG